MTWPLNDQHSIGDSHICIDMHSRAATNCKVWCLVQLPGSIKAADIFDGVLGVMTEVVAKKISSEEETFSGQSLMIFYNNWLGAYSQVAPFARLVCIC
jgi:hypothetical protein